MANGNGHGKQFKALEGTLHEAFANAQARRQLIGIPQLAPDIEQRRSGLQWIGPKYYKTALWWRPWEFVDLLRAKQHARFKGGLLSFIKHLALESIPQTAARPAPRAARIKLREARRRGPTVKAVVREAASG